MINISDLLTVGGCNSTYLTDSWSNIIVESFVAPPKKRGITFEDKNCDCFPDKITGGGDFYGGKPIADQWKSKYDNLKDADCAKLCNEHYSWKNTWDYHVGYKIENVGSKDYRDYNPFDVDAWQEETKDLECPSTCHGNSRFEAGMLQIIDCLLDKKPCNSIVKDF